MSSSNGSSQRRSGLIRAAGHQPAVTWAEGQRQNWTGMGSQGYRIFSRVGSRQIPEPSGVVVAAGCQPFSTCARKGIHAERKGVDCIRVPQKSDWWRLGFIHAPQLNRCIPPP